MSTSTGSDPGIAIDQNQQNPNGTTARKGVLIWLGLAVPWGAFVTYLAVIGAFEPSPGEMPSLTPVFALLPVVILFSLIKLSSPVRQWAGALEAVDLTAFQGWRVLGGVFLILWWFGELPLVFALLAGLGDFAIGFAAPFVTGKLRRAETGATNAARWLILLGLLDFTIAIGVGGLSNPGLLLAPQTGPTGIAMTQFPLVLIPAFIVPNFIMLHLLTWLRLREQ